MLRFGIVAGEASGDILGARLIAGLRKLHPDSHFTGIGGEQMRKAGCECLWSTDDLSVMGVAEVLRKLGTLVKIKHSVSGYFLDNPPDVYIGIDSPDFNFPIENKLRRSGIKTIHYVSPSIWAWREYRLQSIARSTGLMLVLLPFEEQYYKKHNIPVRFVGHPLANEIDIVPDISNCRKQLGLPGDRTIVAIMPGSRRSELARHVRPFLDAACRLNELHDGLLFVSNLVCDDDLDYVQDGINKYAPDLDCRLFTRQSIPVMNSADLVLLASGTAALEAMLLKRPMVVAYKVNWLTYQIAKRLVKLPYVSLPNVLAGEKLVAECLQDDCTGQNLAREMHTLIADSIAREKLKARFTDMHQGMKSNVEYDAAMAVLDHINDR